MKELIEKLKTELDAENLDLSEKLEESEGWDSLASLSIIAMLDLDYGITISNKELREFLNIEELCKFVLDSDK